MMLFRARFMLPAFLAILTGCSQGSDSKLANLFVFNLSSDAYFDVYKDIAGLGSFRSKLARFGSTKWTIENEGKRLSPINLNGRLLRLDLISPDKISNGREAMEKSFRNRSGYWKSIGLDVNAKITSAQVTTGVEVMSNLVNNLTSSRPDNTRLTKEDERALQRLHIVMSAFKIIRTPAKGATLALEEDGSQQEQAPVDDQEQQPVDQSVTSKPPLNENCMDQAKTNAQRTECAEWIVANVKDNGTSQPEPCEQRAGDIKQICGSNEECKRYQENQLTAPGSHYGHCGGQ